MILSYPHSRAAILCFGGWGLQVMFHLLPRLQAAQEQRAALGGSTVHLGKLTSFGAVLADPMLSPQGDSHFTIRQPKVDHSLPPFYIEKILNRLDRDRERSSGVEGAGLLTAAERRAQALLRITEPMLTTLQTPGRGFSAPANGLAPENRVSSQGTQQNAQRRATRTDIFRTGLLHAEPISRLLETNLLDPIRQDDLVDDDPFVQTTLYVIAPLYEPLTSALIWPLLARLMQRTGQRHVSQVVAMFATGSYATDLTRPVEDAATFSALAELEFLSDLQYHKQEPVAFQHLQQLIANTTPHMSELVGNHLFDYLYLLDREKSNQGLAQDSHELAVTTANALEALIVAGGNLYMQEQLGVGMYAGEGRPYSLLGAAGDYVPLTQVLQAVNRQEESRLVREWVLRNSDRTDADDFEAGELPDLTGDNDPNDNDPNDDDPNDNDPDFVSNELAQERVLAPLASHLSDLLEKDKPTTVNELNVAFHFVLPAPTAQQLRRVRAARWSDALQSHLDDLEQYLSLAVGRDFLDETWGISALDAGRAWFLHDVDDRLLPSLVSRMQTELLRLLAASPMGLTQAQAQTQRWLYEVERLRQKVHSVATPSARHLAGVQRMLAQRNWELTYLQAVVNAPTLSGIVLRAGAMTALVAFLALIYLFFAGRNWATQDTISLLGFATGILLMGLFTYRITQDRVRKLRRERVALAQRALTAQLRNSVSNGFVHAYDRLGGLLAQWNRMLAEASSELASLSTPSALPTVPPPGVPLQLVYQPHINEQLWERCLTYLRSQQDTTGHRSEERLERMWGTAKWQNEMRRILSNRSPVEGQSQARTIAQFMRDTVRQSVAPINLDSTDNVRQLLINKLSSEFSIEHLLWRGAIEEDEFNRRLRMLDLGMLPVTPQERHEGAPVRRYIEHVWHRAKPAGNYDVSDRLAIYGMTVEFVASSGDATSELTRTLLDEFNLTLLPTGDPFTLLFLRAIHGLGLGDLDAIRRYQEELTYLSPAERQLILLSDALWDSVYQMRLDPTPRRDPLELRYASPVRRD